MAFPTVATLNVSRQDTDTTTHTMALPTSIAAGDLLLALLGVDGAPAVTWPGGWTAITPTVDGTTASTDARLEFRYRIADGSEGANISISTDVAEMSNHQTWRITSWHGTTPPEATFTSGAAITTPDPPSLTPSWGSDDTLWVAFFVANGNQTVSVYPLPNNQRAATNGAAAGVNVASCTDNQTTATLDPSTFTKSASSSARTVTLAVRPATGGGAPTITRRMLLGVGV